MKKLFSNIFFNALYQVFLILIPFITIPYLSRVIGPESMGTNSYIVSISLFLGIIINFGLNQFGVREVAKRSFVEKTEFFFEAWKIQGLIGTVILVIYIICCLIFANSLYLTQVFYLIAAIFDISWYFIGIEKFKKVVIRNSFSKIIGVLLIFVLVKSKDDLLIYMLINSLTLAISTIFFWIELRNELNQSFLFFLKRLPLKMNHKYFKSMFHLLLPQLAMNIYLTLDKVIVGNIAGNTELSYYDQSQKIARIILAIITSMSVILMPTIAKLGDNTYRIQKFFSRSLYYTNYLSCLFMTALVVTSCEIVPLFFGDGFKDMVLNMAISSLLIPFIAIGGVFGNQLTLGTGRYKDYSIPYYVGAFVSVILLGLLTYLFDSKGSSVAIVLTEFSVFILRMYLIRDKYSLIEVIKNNYTSWLVAIALVIFITKISFDFSNTLFNAMCKTSLVVVVFLLVSVIKKDILFNDLRTMVMYFSKKDNS